MIALVSVAQINTPASQPAVAGGINEPTVLGGPKEQVLSLVWGAQCSQVF